MLHSKIESELLSLPYLDRNDRSAFPLVFLYNAVFFSKSVHFRAALVVLALKSANDGNDDEVNAENDDASGALN